MRGQNCVPSDFKSGDFFEEEREKLSLFQLYTPSPYSIFFSRAVRLPPPNPSTVAEYRKVGEATRRYHRPKEEEEGGGGRGRIDLISGDPTFSDHPPSGPFSSQIPSPVPTTWPPESLLLPLPYSLSVLPASSNFVRTHIGGEWEERGGRIEDEEAVQGEEERRRGQIGDRKEEGPPLLLPLV